MPSCHESCDSVIWLEETGGDKQCHYKGTLNTEMIAPSSFLASRRPSFPMSHIPLSAKPPTPSYSDSVGCFASQPFTRRLGVRYTSLSGNHMVGLPTISVALPRKEWANMETLEQSERVIQHSSISSLPFLNILFRSHWSLMHSIIAPDRLTLRIRFKYPGWDWGSAIMIRLPTRVLTTIDFAKRNPQRQMIRVSVADQAH